MWPFPVKFRMSLSVLSPWGGCVWGGEEGQPKFRCWGPEIRFSLFLNNFSMKSGRRSGRKELKKKHNYLASPCLPVRGFLAFCNKNSGILGRKFGGWGAGGEFHEHQQEQRAPGRPRTGQRCRRVGSGTLLVCTNPAGCACSSELLGQPESVSARSQA